jgi:ABC-type multidrug transport system fused ATPase/permease subunit
MTDAPRARSVIETIKPFRWRIALTYALTVIEDLLELSYPWATGVAINGLLAQDYRMIAPLMIAWALHTTIGCGRQMYDTRLYTEVYNTVVIDTVLRQRQSGIEHTKVAARSAMSREFVTFFEKDMPVVLNTLVSIVGSAAILFYYDLWIGGTAALLFVPVAIINRSYMRRSLMLNEGLNNQLEHEVGVIETAQEGAVTRHFSDVRSWRIKLSDADALNWTAIEGLSILIFVLVLLRVTHMPGADVGTIFAMFVYVWRLMEKLDTMPQIVQQLMRLKDIRRRIEAGASIEAIGEQVQSAQTQPADKERASQADQRPND